MLMFRISLVLWSHLESQTEFFLIHKICACLCVKNYKLNLIFLQLPSVFTGIHKLSTRHVSAVFGHIQTDCAQVLTTLHVVISCTILYKHLVNNRIIQFHYQHPPALLINL